MYLTFSRGNSSENTNHTWAEINTYSVYDYADMGVTRSQVMGLLQPGDDKGPVAGEVGYGEEAPNATVQVRGQTSSTYPCASRTRPSRTAPKPPVQSGRWASFSPGIRSGRILTPRGPRGPS